MISFPNQKMSTIVQCGDNNIDFPSPPKSIIPRENWKGPNRGKTCLLPSMKGRYAAAPEACLLKVYSK